MTIATLNPNYRRNRLTGLIDPKALGAERWTVALLHMNGANGSTTFTDETGKYWSNTGGCAITTDSYVLGGASGYFSNTNDCLTVANTTDFQFGTGDLTIDFWAKIESTSRAIIFSFAGVFGATYPDLTVEVIDTTHIKFDAYVVNGLVVRVNSPAFTANVFHHFAVIRSANNFYLAVDGQLGTPQTYAGALDYDPTRNITIGYTVAGGSSYRYKGWIDEFRVSKGIARWTNNFTPPTNEYSM